MFHDAHLAGLDFKQNDRIPLDLQSWTTEAHLPAIFAEQALLTTHLTERLMKGNAFNGAFVKPWRDAWWTLEMFVTAWNFFSIPESHLIWAFSEMLLDTWKADPQGAACKERSSLPKQECNSCKRGNARDIMIHD